jgi:DNA-binding NtrC family response regulator
VEGVNPASTVLVMDDEPQLLRLMVRVLERAGHSVLSSSSGERALEIFRQRLDEIDAVVLDMAIPPNGAGEVMEAMSDLREGLGVVLTSGDLLSPELREPLRLRSGVFLRKPFVPRALVRAVADVTGASGSSDAVAGAREGF